MYPGTSVSFKEMSGVKGEGMKLETAMSLCLLSFDYSVFGCVLGTVQEHVMVILKLR